MKVNLLLNPANQSWIIQKIAEQLAQAVINSGSEVSITADVDPSADIVHHLSWAFANIRTSQPSTMFITHLDDQFKLSQVRSTLSKDVKVGICMSSDTMRSLLAYGIPETSLYFISPAHDGLIKPRRIVIGICSRVYPDGRKRENLLREVAALVDMSPFEFRIFGVGWEPTIPALEAAGAVVKYFGESDNFRKDYESIIENVPNFDFYLYLGMDEGSLGTLDALAAGVATIITPQGFHLDLPNGITHPVVTANDLKNVLNTISTPTRERTAAVSGLTWDAYGRRHLDLWHAIVRGVELPGLPQTGIHAPSDVEVLRQHTVRTNSFSARRLLSAVSHMGSLRLVRGMIDRKRRRR